MSESGHLGSSHFPKAHRDILQCFVVTNQQSNSQFVFAVLIEDREMRTILETLLYLCPQILFLNYESLIKIDAFLLRLTDRSID